MGRNGTLCGRSSLCGKDLSGYIWLDVCIFWWNAAAEFLPTIVLLAYLFVSRHSSLLIQFRIQPGPRGPGDSNARCNLVAGICGVGPQSDCGYLRRDRGGADAGGLTFRGRGWSERIGLLQHV